MLLDWAGLLEEICWGGWWDQDSIWLQDAISCVDQKCCSEKSIRKSVAQNFCSELSIRKSVVQKC